MSKRSHHGLLGLPILLLGCSRPPQIVLEDPVGSSRLRGYPAERVDREPGQHPRTTPAQETPLAEEFHRQRAHEGIELLGPLRGAAGFRGPMMGVFHAPVLAAPENALQSMPVDAFAAGESGPEPMLDLPAMMQAPDE